MSEPAETAGHDDNVEQQQQQEGAGDAKRPESTSQASKERERLVVGGIVIEGHSIGGQQTCIILPGLKVLARALM